MPSADPSSAYEQFDARLSKFGFLNLSDPPLSAGREKVEQTRELLGCVEHLGREANEPLPFSIRQGHIWAKISSEGRLIRAQIFQIPPRDTPVSDKSEVNYYCNAFLLDPGLRLRAVSPHGRREISKNILWFLKLPDVSLAEPFVHLDIVAYATLPPPEFVPPPINPSPTRPPSKMVRVIGNIAQLVGVRTLYT